MVDFERYTVKKTCEHLVLIEDHLKEFGSDSFFCKACLKDKHFLALRGYQKECEGVCSNQDFWKDLHKWLDKSESKLKDLTKEEAIELSIEARNLRKRLEMEEDIMSPHLKVKEEKKSDQVKHISESKIDGDSIAKQPLKVDEKEDSESGIGFLIVLAAIIGGAYFLFKNKAVALTGPNPAPSKLKLKPPLQLTNDPTRRILATMRVKI